MKKLKRRRDRLDRRLARNQKWRARLRLVHDRMVEHGQKGLAKRLKERVMEPLTKRIRELHEALKVVEDKIADLQAQADGSRREFVKWCESQVGLAEDDPRRVKMATDLGASPSWPWCSIFVAWGIWKHGGFSRSELPANPAYSGTWLTWNHGTRIPVSQVQNGDLLIHDWGDGGITDHITVKVKGGSIGGNENDRVEKNTSVPWNTVIGVVRPKWN